MVAPLILEAGRKRGREKMGALMSKKLNRVILMGGDYYESHVSIVEHESVGKPRIGIGQNTKIENAIIDKNARIGDNVVISPAGKPEIGRASCRERV